MADRELEERSSKLATVLSEHLGLDALSSQQEADKLLRNAETGASLESLYQSNSTPVADQENMRKAARALTRAVNHIEKVGWHGQKTFTAVLEPFLSNRDYSYLVNSRARRVAKDQLLFRLKSLADGLDKASGEVDLQGKSVMTAFGDEPENKKFKSTKPRKIVAEYFARDCANLYFESTQLRPTVSNKAIPHSQGSMNTAYGPFFDFVKDAFEAAGVDGSAEAWARNAAKEFARNFDS